MNAVDLSYINLFFFLNLHYLPLSYHAFTASKIVEAKIM